MPLDQTAAASSSLVDDLEPLLCEGRERVTVADLVAGMTGAGGLAPIAFVLTLPALLPLPPVVSAVTALPLLFVAPQMVFGRKTLWLPRALANMTMNRRRLQAVLRRTLPWLERMERVVRPRLTGLTGPVGRVMTGLACTLLALVLVLPVPFGNVLPALTACFLTLGLARRDGLVVLLGIVLLAASGLVIGLGLHAVRLGAALF
jgi:hypothetical protein